MKKSKLKNFLILNCSFTFFVFTFDFEIWAGTQAAKGGRLSKGSVLPKGKMEK